MKDSNAEMIKLARSGNMYHDEYEASKERTLKSMDKVRRYDQLYHDGYSLGASGGVLDDQTELVEENGKMIPKKDHRNFKAGYKKGLEVFKIRVNALKNNNQGDIHKTR